MGMFDRFKKVLAAAPAAADVVASAALPKLPAWAQIIAARDVEIGKASIAIAVDTAACVREWFDLLGVKQPDQYWLEVAYQCAKMDLQAALEGTVFDPRKAGKPALFRFTRAPEFALTAYPPGKGIEAASRGKEAREHYKRVRGRLPF